jgi:hypothetical protein
VFIEVVIKKQGGFIKWEDESNGSVIEQEVELGILGVDRSIISVDKEVTKAIRVEVAVDSEIIAITS